MPEVRPIDANALEQFYECGTDPDDTYADMTYIRAEHIDNAPTIEAEPVRHGRWIEGTSRGSYSIYCSYCGSYKETICPSEYCPNCGARMDATDTNVGGKGGAYNG